MNLIPLRSSGSSVRAAADSHRRRRFGLRQLINLATIIAVIAAAGTVVFALSPAQRVVAAEQPFGYTDPDDGTMLGGRLVNGVLTYCVEPYGGSGDGVPSTLPLRYGDYDLSDQAAASLNMVYSTYGQQHDNDTAAAVELYSWTAIGQIVKYAQFRGYEGDDVRGAAAFFARRAGVQADAVMARYDTIVADATNVIVGQSGGTGRIEISTDALNPAEGTLTLQDVTPSNGQATVTLINGVFADSGSPTKSAVVAGGSYRVRGVPPEGVTSFKITATADFNVQGGWLPEVAIYDNDVQIMGGPGRPAVTSWQVTGGDSDPRSLRFNPVVTTKVASKFLGAGDKFCDEVQFAAKDSTWYRSATTGYVRVRADGILYGPALAPFQESVDPPVSATVVDDALSVTTDTSRGPNGIYSVCSSKRVIQSGYYTYVWSIFQEDQSIETQPYLPDRYGFRDAFGQETETHIAAMSFDISTRVPHAQAALGELVTDEVSIRTRDGGWVVDGRGMPVPVTVKGDWYYSSTRPVESDEPPVGAEIVATTEFTISNPGSTLSAPIAAPFKPGFLIARWCVQPEDQDPEWVGAVNATCDRYGVPSEVVEITAPTISTHADDEVTVWDGFADHATVSGKVPEGTTFLSTLYKAPENGDVVCENQVLETEPVSVAAGVHEAARYDTPVVRVPPGSEGTYWWVEELRTEMPDGKTVTIAKGDCGLVAETQVILSVTVKTQATPHVVIPATGRDVALIAGSIPSKHSGIRAELSFSVYERRGGEPVCDLTTLVAALPQTAVVTGAGEYKSDEYAFTRPGTYDWVETLTYVHPDGSRTVEHIGACGAEGERTVVTAEPSVLLAETGIETSTILVVGFSAFGAGALLVLAAARNRRASARFSRLVRS